MTLVVSDLSPSALSICNLLTASASTLPAVNPVILLLSMSIALAIAWLPSNNITCDLFTASVLTVPAANPVILLLFTSIAPTDNPSGVVVKSPVDAPVKVPVPNLITSSDSSNPINILSLSPRSIIIPESPVGTPVVPFANSINLSSTIKFVADISVTSPLITTLSTTTVLPEPPIVMLLPDTD